MRMLYRLIICIVVILTIGITATNCVKYTEKTTDKTTNDFHEQVGKNGVEYKNNRDNHIYEFDYKNHHYIWFEKFDGRIDSQGYGFAGVVHDPDCYCHHNQTVEDKE